MIIKEVSARIVKDSRGTDTIAVSVNGCEEGLFQFFFKAI